MWRCSCYTRHSFPGFVMVFPLRFHALYDLSGALLKSKLGNCHKSTLNSTSFHGGREWLCLLVCQETWDNGPQPCLVTAELITNYLAISQSVNVVWDYTSSEGSLVNHFVPSLPQVNTKTLIESKCEESQALSPTHISSGAGSLHINHHQTCWTGYVKLHYLCPFILFVFIYHLLGSSSFEQETNTFFST